jgi:hypothetical protein
MLLITAGQVLTASSKPGTPAHSLWIMRCVMQMPLCDRTCMKLTNITEELLCGSAQSFVHNQVDYRKECVYAWCYRTSNMTTNHIIPDCHYFDMETSIISSSKEIQSIATIK